MNNLVVEIDFDQINKVARILRNKLKITIDDFADPRYYPSKNEDPENVLRYFIFMVAIDHRLSRPGKPYEGFVDGEFYHGADLLYRLGSKKFHENPEWFDPKHMANITLDEVRDWLSVKKPKKVEPPDVEVRAMLLRDIGLKLVKLYSSSVSKLIESSRNYLKSLQGGLIDRLKMFRAYEDPVEKKPYLFFKFIERRGLFRPIDKENVEVPVDNHLTRIALRLGLVKVRGILRDKILQLVDFNWEEDVMLRIAVRRAYKELALKADIEPTILDDFLWMFGRKCCLREEPSCNVCSMKCNEYGWCINGKCILSDVCLAAKGVEPMYVEHSYLNTWYY